MYHIVYVVSQTFRIWAPEGKEGIERHGLNVARLISVLWPDWVDPQDRDAWRTSVRSSLELATPLDGTQTAP